MVKYIYTYLDEFFDLSDWNDDIKGPFGLRPPPGDWAEFKARIKELDDACAEGERVKVIYAARHGQAEHNAVMERYNCTGHEAEQYANLLDPYLTVLGRSQAAATASAVQREAKRGMPLPEKWFVSPLKRAGETCGIEWGWLFGDDTSKSGGVDAAAAAAGGDLGHGVPASVVENIREHLHVHICDSRVSVTELKTEFPSFAFPDDMSDLDTIWKSGKERDRETEEELVARCGKGIAEVLHLSEGSTYVSVTAHSGAMRGIYKSLGVPARPLVVGEMNVLVLRVKEVQE
ncbi:hypothetical protein CI109_102495 [Kwoniella shandongensis]|uniref:Uncharacterized protein n=1 Tax=Kwoniella shandongensis TaxID=1734106 RepID=A0A5M6C525_9TREE|nr:uncharacterized protein CI109_003187 [Kwoniella shandongensis]KAA5528289.1 hypothetical protein CI109_003187 [Kwoniella shandongensis]